MKQPHRVRGHEVRALAYLDFHSVSHAHSCPTLQPSESTQSHRVSDDGQLYGITVMVETLLCHTCNHGSY